MFACQQYAPHMAFSHSASDSCRQPRACGNKENLRCVQGIRRRRRKVRPRINVMSLYGPHEQSVSLNDWSPRPTSTTLARVPKPCRKSTKTPSWLLLQSTADPPFHPQLLPSHWRANSDIRHADLARDIQHPLPSYARGKYSLETSRPTSSSVTLDICSLWTPEGLLFQRILLVCLEQVPVLYLGDELLIRDHCQSIASR